MGLSSKLILALDMSDVRSGMALLQETGSSIQNIKIGPGLFLQEGPSIITELHGRGYKVFLDLKHHDIPNTVRLAVKAAKEMGVWMLSVHTSGGLKMLEAAALEAAGNPQLVGITVLTSLNEEGFREIGFASSIDSQVERLSMLAKKAGLAGVVASPHEIIKIRAAVGKEMLIVTPGIRLENEAKHDQARTMTPRQAIDAGADYLVIGRPLLEAKDPKEAVASILASLGST